MKKVIVFGTFDVLHKGHLNFFEQAKKFGDFLVVVVARDKNVEKIKGAAPLRDEVFRLKELETSVLVDKVVLGNKEDRYLILKQEKPEVICLGYDQEVDEKKLQAKLKEYKLEGAQVFRLEAYKPEKYKSSLLKKKYEYKSKS
jgi:FAD synthetase